MDSYVCTQATSDRGLATMATVVVPANTEIIAETPLLLTVDATVPVILQSVNSLSHVKRETYMSLSVADNHSRMRTEVGIWHSNSFRLTSPGGKEWGYGVFEIISRINHSCCPNAKVTWDKNVWKMFVTTMRIIESGEEICVNYLDAPKLDLDVVLRREELLEKWGFLCSCKRCLQEDTFSEREESFHRRTVENLYVVSD
ncbi:hypothetical protein RUND412_002261 [Rhizina undulata]